MEELQCIKGQQQAGMSLAKAGEGDQSSAHLSLPSSGSRSPPLLQPSDMAWLALSFGLGYRRQPGREAQPGTATSLALLSLLQPLPWQK